MTSPKYDYDLLVIGAGSGGVPCARTYAATGAKVAIIESVRVGGTCVLRGCVPKKLMVYASEFAHAFEDAPGFGWKVGKNKIDWEWFINRKNQELDRLNGIYLNLLQNSGVEIINGFGSLQDEHTVNVATEDGDKTYTAKNILIATGTTPKIPDCVDGMDCAMTSDDILDLKEIPEHLVVIGGGYIGLEFASIFNTLGSKVEILLRGNQILRGFDEEITVFLREQLTNQGIIFRNHTEADKLTKADDNKCTLTIKNRPAYTNCHVLNATGRVPNTKGLGLEKLGINLKDDGSIKVDDQLRTNIPHIFAVGDVVGQIELTPYAIAQGRALTNLLANNEPVNVSQENVPSAVFTTPPIGSVGMTETDAREQYGNEIDIFASEFRAMAYVLPDRNERTLMKMIIHKESDRVLGIHIVGKDAPEIIQGFAVAMKAGVTKDVVDSTIGIHPGSAEELVTLREART